jgi:hypothetical protein
MRMRRSLVRIWVGITALLLIFLGLTTLPEIQRAQRFARAQEKLAILPPIERLQVLDRIAWLNGQSIMPSVPQVSTSDSDQQFRNGIETAKARLAAASPLPPDLEDLARDANSAPQWEIIRWRIGLFAGAIALLWALLLVGFWITSEQTFSQHRARTQPVRIKQRY